MKRRLSPKLWVLAASLLHPISATIFAQSKSLYGEELVARATARNLAEDPLWHRLLFFSSGWFGRNQSLVDSPGFFLDPRGKWHPQAELTTTIRAIANQSPLVSEDKAYQCRYPARYRYLASRLEIDQEKIPTKSCPALEAWMRMIDGERVSLVFSSYYLNNPASMMGHTFLQFHRRRHSEVQSELLDNAVNFAANPWTENPFLYPILGLTGFFPGTFSLQRYYIKVQEYNNFESRDLWSFELSFRPEQVQRLLYSVWEMGPHHIDYYYFDENCSYVLLSLLEIADPKISLAERFSMFTNPSDTIRIVAETPNLVRGVSFRPSSRSRFLSRYSELTRSQKNLLEDILDDDIQGYPQGISDRRLADVIDAAIAFIEFDEGLGGAVMPKKRASLYSRLLSERSQLNQTPVALTLNPTVERPDLGHWTSRWGLMLGVEDGAMAGLEWRPALHDVHTPIIGYSRELNIQMGRTILRYTAFDRRTFLERFEVVEILALNLPKPKIYTPAWHLNFGIENIRPCTGGSAPNQAICHRVRLQGGPGVALGLLSESVILYAVSILDAGLSNQPGLAHHIGSGFQIGLTVQPNEKSRATLTGYRLRRAGDRVVFDGWQELNTSISWSPYWETRLTFKRGPPKSEALYLSVYRYY